MTTTTTILIERRLLDQDWETITKEILLRINSFAKIGFTHIICFSWKAIPSWNKVY